MANVANILRDAEVGVDHYQQFNHIRNFTPKVRAESKPDSAINLTQ